MFDYRLEHIISYWAKMEKPQVVGPAPEGMRLVFPVAEGEVTGPKFRGKVLRGGGDWLTVRSDGVQILDVRACTRTDDGAVIYVEYTGVGDLGEDGYQRFLRGDLPPRIPLRAGARFHAADPRYSWLNRLQCLLVGEAETGKGRVAYDVYAVS
jgi:hypothetical protein